MNRSPVVLRAASPDDRAAIVRVFWACWTRSYPGVLPAATIARLDRAGADDLWATALSSAGPGSIVVASSDDDTVVGVTRTTADLVNSLYVHPESQGCGVGAVLLDCAEGRIVDRGHRAGRLWVFARNQPSRDFYAAHGWSPDGTTHCDELFGEPEIGLRKVLTTR